MLFYNIDLTDLFCFFLSVSNACQFKNGACGEGHLCLPNGSGGRSCICADSGSEGSGEVDSCNDVA